MEFLTDVSSTSAADIIKGDDVTVEVLFRTSRRWLFRFGSNKVISSFLLMMFSCLKISMASLV